MKKKAFLASLFLPMTLGLASCGELSIIVRYSESTSSLSVPTEVLNEIIRVDVKAVSLVGVSNRQGQIAFSSLPSIEATGYSLDTINDGVYVSLKTFASLVQLSLGQKYQVVYQLVEETYSLIVYDEAGEERYILSINGKEGWVSHWFEGTSLWETAPLELDPTLEKKTHILREGEKSSYHDFRDSGIRVLDADEEARFDLSFLEGETKRYLGCHFTSSAKEGYLYLWHNEEELNRLLSFPKLEQSVATSLKNAYRNSYLDAQGQWLIPAVLAEQQRALYCYFLGQEEGLWEYRGVENPGLYFLSSSGYEMTVSQDEDIRGEGYSHLHSLLDDRLAKFIPSPWFGLNKEYLNVALPGSRQESSILAKARIASLRKDASFDPTVVHLDQDRRVAVFGADALDEKGYASLRQNLLSLSEIESVTDVLLDFSYCEEGSMDVLFKTLALISPSNYAKVYEWDSSTGAIGYIDARVDVNEDGKFDVNETFGKRFKFHLLQSGFTGGVGNLLCCAALKQGFASIWGEQGSGGECALDRFRLPLGQQFLFSSKHHYLWINEKGLPETVDFGAKPTFSWGYEQGSYDPEILKVRLQREE